jgi:hypothetical protein
VVKLNVTVDPAIRCSDLHFHVPISDKLFGLLDGTDSSVPPERNNPARILTRNYKHEAYLLLVVRRNFNGGPRQVRAAHAIWSLANE